jgi:hypothetical protein
MNSYFIPGSRHQLKNANTPNIYKKLNNCQCIQQNVKTIKSGWNSPVQVENIKISQILSNNLGGKITWGNYGIPYNLNYLGRIEGQSGGSLKPLRNTF